MKISKQIAGMALAMPVLLATMVQGAFAVDGRSVDWQIGFQDAATPVMHEITWFHNSLLMPIITVITLFVLALLIYCIIKFNAKANPVPTRTSHNTLIEVLWTVIPILILVVIAIPSFRLLYLQRVIPPVDITIKATGNQWYWSYEYPDNGDIEFDAVMVEDEDLKPGQLRLLTVDNEVVVPVNKVVRVIVTASDVLHNWAMPAFGTKMDAVPGRLNETWFKAERIGVYYGQCSELCGVRHAYMPIAVRVVSEADFKAWTIKAKQAGIEEAGKMFAAKPANDAKTSRKIAAIKGSETKKNSKQ